jgi:hypothetical protein
MQKKRFDAKINGLIDRILRREYCRLVASGGLVYKRPPSRFRWKMLLQRGRRSIKRRAAD